jgi:hypothetical protein
MAYASARSEMSKLVGLRNRSIVRPDPEQKRWHSASRH